MKEFINLHFWKLAWRNLVRHWVRNLSTGLAIGLGFAGIVLLGGYLLRMEYYLVTQSVYLNHRGHVSIYRPDGVDRHLSNPAAYSLSLEDQKNIEQAIRELSEPPEFVAKYLEGQGLLSNGCTTYPFLGFAVSAETERRVRNHPEVLSRIPELTKLAFGRGFWEEPFLADGILISPRLAKRLRKPMIAGDPLENREAIDKLITDCGSAEVEKIISSHSALQLIGASFSKGMAAADARIVGHFSTGLSLADDTALLMPIEMAQNFFDTDSVTSVSIYLKNNSRFAAGKVSEEMKKIILHHGWNFDIIPFYDEQISPYYVGAMTFVYVMTLFFLFLVCGVAALAILNSLQISFMERRTEVGTLRSIGFRPEKILELFAREIMLLTSISLIAGGMVAKMIAEILNASQIRFAVPGLSGTLQFLLKPGLIFSLAVALVFMFVSLLTVKFAGQRWANLKIVELLENK